MKLKAISLAASALALSAFTAGAQTAATPEVQDQSATGVETQGSTGVHTEGTTGMGATGTTGMGTTTTGTTGMGTSGMQTQDGTGLQHQGMMGNSGFVNQTNYENLVTADEIIGANIYSMNSEYDENAWNEARTYEERGENWENIGSVNDIVLSSDGRMVGLGIETGGWLDIGDDVVLVSLNDVRLVNDNGSVAVVTRMSQEELESKPELEQGWFQ
ncbi:PRC-barrel domain-containing protein [Falsirhodobacter deserti]|uniref:PRC-barrel domain-containing protein n=1 Tax=Falsirhodobacter deserti TaxID=1365611 RepID=UPI0013E292EC|nr:PRC-barrel domain-containing protein [Falsirhodobacter deserti]